MIQPVKPFSPQWSHASTMARSLHAAGVRTSPLRLMLSPPGAFLKQIVLKQAWRDGTPGWLAAASTAAASLMKHAVLLELGLAPAAEIRASEPGPSQREDREGLEGGQTRQSQNAE